MGQETTIPLQQRMVIRLKRRFVKGGRQPVRVKGGLTRGARMLLDRRVDLQREFGLYESETRLIVRKAVGPGSLVIDVGAGDGYEALAYARLGARVYAFESDLAVVERLRSNLVLNPSLAERVTVFAEPFPSASPLPPADFAKLDVDGAERLLLDHLLEIPTLLIETHSAKLEADCIGFLEDRGYQTAVIQNARWRAFYPEWRPIEQNRWLLAQSAQRL
jgi:hypothetical protein